MKNIYEGAERRKAWHLDKKVPLALFFLLLSQTGTAIWWASGINSVVKSNAENLTQATIRLQELESREREGGKLVERVVRVETMLENVQQTVNRISNSLEEPRRRK